MTEKRFLLQEEKRLMNEINAQKGLTLRKFGKIIQLNALMRTIEQQNRCDGTNYWL